MRVEIVGTDIASERGHLIVKALVVRLPEEASDRMTDLRAELQALRDELTRMLGDYHNFVDASGRNVRATIPEREAGINWGLDVAAKPLPAKRSAEATILTKRKAKAGPPAKATKAKGKR